MDNLANRTYSGSDTTEVYLFREFIFRDFICPLSKVLLMLAKINYTPHSMLECLSAMTDHTVLQATNMILRDTSDPLQIPLILILWLATFH